MITAGKFIIRRDSSGDQRRTAAPLAPARCLTPRRSDPGASRRGAATPEQGFRVPSVWAITATAQGGAPPCGLGDRLTWLSLMYSCS